MRYTLREGIVCRDIAGIYFIIDTHDKHFYRNKQVNCVNESAYVMIRAMANRAAFSAKEIAEDVGSCFLPSDDVPTERIERDVCLLIEGMRAKGWLEDAE